MKYFNFYILIMMSGLFSNAYAATLLEIQNDVSVYATNLVGHSGDYFDHTFDGDLTSPVSPAAIEAAVTGSDMTTYARTFDYHMPTGPENAYLDLNFGRNVYNNDGNDLVLFFAGNATTFLDGSFKDFTFSIDVGADGSVEINDMGVTDSTTFYNMSGGLEDLPSGMTADSITEADKLLYGVSFFASYALIDLDALGFDQHTPLGDIRIYLGDKSIPSLAGVGAYNLAAVPLPLSAVLFGSGLALLGWVGRRKTA